MNYLDQSCHNIFMPLKMDQNPKLQKLGQLQGL